MPIKFFTTDACSVPNTFSGVRIALNESMLKCEATAGIIAGLAAFGANTRKNKKSFDTNVNLSRRQSENHG